ncbi:MAG TPA: hypothetical protein VGR47_06100 [Terracidiphilus sp.]|nr:hypothetical protein [Terracidiphilus sp.]
MDSSRVPDFAAATALIVIHRQNWMAAPLTVAGDSSSKTAVPQAKSLKTGAQFAE